MANEICFFKAPGTALYAVVVNGAADVWNGSGFETPAATNWAAYATPLTQQADTGIYAASFPTGVPSGAFTVAVYERAAETPSVSDAAIASGVIRWSGTSEVTGGNVVFGYM